MTWYTKPDADDLLREYQSFQRLREHELVELEKRRSRTDNSPDIGKMVWDHWAIVVAVVLFLISATYEQWSSLSWLSMGLAIAWWWGKKSGSSSKSRQSLSQYQADQIRIFCDEHPEVAQELLQSGKLTSQETRELRQIMRR